MKYPDNQILYDEICKSKEQNELTEDCTDLLIYMASGTIRKMYFPSYLTKTAIAFAIVESEKQLKHFNPEHPAKPNSASNYFTEIIKRAYAKFYLKIKK